MKYKLKKYGESTKKTPGELPEVFLIKNTIYFVANPNSLIRAP
ncbi:MAG: hypothetical protein K0R31_622 [Clostridiales bacterium]|jgi:hypothetical protein|nr:hypothetical protein [Clostridiales bacterium]